MGEPPLFLAASVFYAIKDAITAARAESGLTGPFRLDSPATPERIRNACEDKFTKLVCSNFLMLTELQIKHCIKSEQGSFQDHTFSNLVRHYCSKVWALYDLFFFLTEMNVYSERMHLIDQK